MSSILLIRNKVNLPTPPLGLLFLASYLEKYGYNVKICDLSIEDKRLLYELLSSESLLAVGMTSNVSTYYRDIELSRYIKNQFSLPIIIGGPHPSVAPNEYMYEWIDYIVIGDGEESLIKILNAIKNNKKLDRIQKNTVDISNLPNPARHLVDYSKYYSGVNEREKKEFVFISRGCPYNCIFCAGPKIFGSRPRYRNIRNVISELREIREKYKFKNIRIADDLFVADKKYVFQFCKELYKEGLDINLDFQSRIDTVDENIIKIMKGAGFNGVFLGIESGNEETLRKIGKPYSIKKIEETIKLLKKEGYFITGSFTIGYPWEKKDDILNTFRFARNLELDRIRVYIITPLPGTDLYDKYKDKIVTKNYDLYDTRHAVMDGEYLTAHEIQELYESYMKEFEISDN